jgi:hypothetical protein
MFVQLGVQRLGERLNPAVVVFVGVADEEIVLEPRHKRCHRTILD